jgi:tetratricopeptide (TPR) repeat protein
MDDYIFRDLSDAFFKNTAVVELMHNVSVPFRREDLLEEATKGANESDEIPIQVLMENMTCVIGMDPHFRYSEVYVAFLLHTMGKNVGHTIAKSAKKYAQNGMYEDAVIRYRASLACDPFYLDAMYGYARVCRELYLVSSDPDKTGNLKAEALDYFELLTEIFPDYNSGYYYLGYMYLNMGLYVKAEIVWREYMRLSTSPKTPAKDKKEIRERLRQIQGPVEIEHGYNAILRGSYEEGIEMLEPFINSDFNDWWPLYYYLGIGYMETARAEEAIASFKKVLQRNASHLESMQELADIYQAQGDKVNAEKYTKKMEIVKNGL